MTIDERLDRLTERHEALTQTVELLAGDLRGLTTKVDHLTDAVNALVRVAEIHDRRISRLEGQQD